MDSDGWEETEAYSAEEAGRQSGEKKNKVNPSLGYIKLSPSKKALK